MYGISILTSINGIQCRVKHTLVLFSLDELGIHRMENPSHSNRAVSLHIYCPPFGSCKAFDERTGHANTVKVTFWSKYGNREKFGQVCKMFYNYLRCEYVSVYELRLFKESSYFRCYYNSCKQLIVTSMTSCSSVSWCQGQSTWISAKILSIFHVRFSIFSHIFLS